MQSNVSSLSMLALRLPLVLRAVPPTADPRHDPRQKIEIPAADEDTSPKSQFDPIDCHAQNVKFRLEEHRYQRE